GATPGTARRTTPRDQTHREPRGEEPAVRPHVRPLACRRTTETLCQARPRPPSPPSTAPLPTPECQAPVLCPAPASPPATPTPSPSVQDRVSVRGGAGDATGGRPRARSSGRPGTARRCARTPAGVRRGQPECVTWPRARIPGSGARWRRAPLGRPLLAG